ncbi:HMG box protein [Pyrenophora tritici-repentis]|uniref:HMG box n=1 Tax=Pyrenophora tritici-repentis TaxID=45151 RepID=A0A2W1FKB1_9PLEO|nr:HMG box protein [Pyrenophora tritici-repentis]KAF7450306.1 HMG box protein [Pyrenophora tritici-repentis]KAF7572887.1 HMG box protein [Pyrenophora tritici-repentis]KAG9375648.1 hypothetical protein A1F94_013786 [Pyrenophora tritici-repentis]KAI1507799.1 HMG box [Pyrenophora tritici-repentis]
MQGPWCCKQKCDNQGQAKGVQASRRPAANTAKARKSRSFICSSSNRPLSDYSDVIRRAAIFTQKWVNRPAHVRRRETELRGGYVARPLNSFMLYRLAYIEEALYTQPKQQKLSAIIADSWRKEPEVVRQAYDAYAKTERRNHHEAYPGYKFSPKKKKLVKEEDASPEEELMPIFWDECNCDSCRLAVATSKKQIRDTVLDPINAGASVPLPAPVNMTAWQPMFLPIQPTLWQDQYSNQVAGSNLPWPSVMTPSLFLGPYSAMWEPTMPTTNGSPIADSSWSGPGMLAGVNYAMRAHDPSYCIYCVYCGYQCTPGEAGALP